jgi:hypothetical protein
MGNILKLQSGVQKVSTNPNLEKIKFQLLNLKFVIIKREDFSTRGVAPLSAVFSEKRSLDVE